MVVVVARRHPDVSTLGVVQTTEVLLNFPPEDNE